MERRDDYDKFFYAVITGKERITPNNSCQYLEAICAQPDPVICANKLISSPHALDYIQIAFSFDFSLQFLNGPAAALLTYFFGDPVLKFIGGGDILNKIIDRLVDPPGFWFSLAQAFKKRDLSDQAEIGFAQLLLQLVSTPTEQAANYREWAKDPDVIGRLCKSTVEVVTSISHRIRQIILAYDTSIRSAYEAVAGGRHDNDFADFRQISVVPTLQEIQCQEAPFLLRNAEISNMETSSTRNTHYLETQFRLIRENLIHRVCVRTTDPHAFVASAQLIDVFTGIFDRRSRWALVFQCKNNFQTLREGTFVDFVDENHKSFLQDNHVRHKVIKHRSLARIMVEGKLISLAEVHHDEERLVRNPPEVVLRLVGSASAERTLIALRSAPVVHILLCDIPFFTFEPALKALQSMGQVPLSEELLFGGTGYFVSSSSAWRIVQMIEADPDQNLKQLLNTPDSLRLDREQAAALVSCLTSRVALVQGPSATGKSLVGVLLAKILHDHTPQRILVLCNTDHVLDQTLQDLINIGIPSEQIVRLGGPVTNTNLQHLSLYSHDSARDNLISAFWSTTSDIKRKSEEQARELERKFRQIFTFGLDYHDILHYLRSSHPECFAAFRVSEIDVDPTYLIDRWMHGFDAGILKDTPDVREAAAIWDVPQPTRDQYVEKWKAEMLEEAVTQITSDGTAHDEWVAQLDRMGSYCDNVILTGKRILGCTTAGAAEFSENLLVVPPDVLLVEGAGEIMEGHVLAALGSTVQQLILIGDQKQPRPRVNNPVLKVESCAGYDLDRSLFERLILKGFPYHMLQTQYRMNHDIAGLIRDLIYPEIKDAPETQPGPRFNVTGIQQNIIFVNRAEGEGAPSGDDRSSSLLTSDESTHEIKMILKIVKYMAQQGYGTDKMAVLTLHPSQLHTLRAALQSDTDPVLNDLDSHDLVRAGLRNASAAKVNKGSLRTATINDFQGEESTIVIASLSGSGAEHEIVPAWECLRVLLSRAKDGLIMIGNAETLMRSESRRDRVIWTKFIDLLKNKGYIFDGFPVECEEHARHQRILVAPSDFDKYCPEGGCTETCDEVLECDHPCPLRCHHLVDHSKMPCSHPTSGRCSADRHTLHWICNEGMPICRRCKRDKERAKAQAEENYKDQRKRDAEQEESDEELADLELRLKTVREAQRDVRQSLQRSSAIEKRKRHLREIISTMHRNAPDVITEQNPTLPSQAISQHAQIPSAPPQLGISPIPGTFSIDGSQGDSLSSAGDGIMKPALSAARQEWQRRKDIEGLCNDAVETLMEMTGLEDVKWQFLRIMDKVDVMKRQDVNIGKERLNLVLLGNPGTGKTTVARLYARFLESIKVLPGAGFIETTGSRLANDGVSGAKSKIDELVDEEEGGAIFIDEAYQLVSEHNFQGSQVLDFLLAEMENRVGTVVFILAGYNKPMEKFFEHNQGLPSRFPYQIQFADYTDNELLAMFGALVETKYKGRMYIEGGPYGLYARIAIRRLGRGRGREGFGNARALQNMFSKICEFQAQRISKKRREGYFPDDFKMLKEDLIGPEPSRAIVESEPWKKLQAMTGLQSVKDSVKNLLDLITANYYRELNEKEPLHISFNRVFVGSPGTGKTTVAILYGQILAQLRLLSSGEVVVKNPADFVGYALGASENNTKAILRATAGKVLVIDEAYMLYGGGTGSGGGDSYRTAVIDTIVAEVQSVPGEDRCVLLLGYKDQIVEMFQNVNPGLSRRFDIENAFVFEDFDDTQLRQILELKLKAQDLDATEKAKDTAINTLSRARHRPHFGNAGEVENILGKAKERYQKRVTYPTTDVLFEPQDFDPDFDRDEHASENLAKLFEDVVGCEEVVKKLGGYQRIAKRVKDNGRDMRKNIPTNFVFKGPPGTGKTTTARKMGQVYYDMGFLSSSDVIECSASDLIGEYVGKTGPKTRGVFEKALGKVLFIDEAYRLAEGSFAKEAIDELVSILTKESFAGKMVVILAGYDAEINKLLQTNPGLSSRFPEQITFHNITAAQCLSLLIQDLRNEKIDVPGLPDPTTAMHAAMEKALHIMAMRPSWGNARDVKTLAQQITNRAWECGSPVHGNDDVKLTLSGREVLNIVRERMKEQADRALNVAGSCACPGSSSLSDSPMQTAHPEPLTLAPPGVQIATTVTQTQQHQEPNRQHDHAPPPNAPQDQGEQRDSGVSDAVWEQLQLDTQSYMADQRLKDEKERMKEEQVQAKLQKMGVCSMGYRWIKQAHGYRCAGGTHFISNGDLGL